nr:hypothetical protein [Caldimonas sp.]
MSTVAFALARFGVGVLVFVVADARDVLEDVVAAGSGASQGSVASAFGARSVGTAGLGAAAGEADAAASLRRARSSSAKRRAPA